MDVDEPNWGVSGWCHSGWLGFAVNNETNVVHDGVVALRVNHNSRDWPDYGRHVQLAQSVCGLKPGRYAVSCWVAEANGLGEMSRIFHRFYNNHLIRGKYKTEKRPLLINSWEAAYFDFDKEKSVYASINNKNIICGVYIKKSNDLYEMFESHKNDIEEAIGAELEYKLYPLSFTITYCHPDKENIYNEGEWEKYFAWICEQAIKMKNVFTKYIN